MSIGIGVGTSENPDVYAAGREAAKGACQQAEEDFLDLLIVFASAKLNQQSLLRGIKSVCQQASIIGCSTAGEITTRKSAKNSVAVMGFKCENLGLTYSTGLGYALSQDARSAGQKCALKALKAAKTNLHKKKVFIMLPDGLSGNNSEVIQGAQEVLGTNFPIVGAAAGDDFLFQKTFQYYDGKVFSDSVAGILFAGEISAGIGIRHGWQPIGKYHRITKSCGNIIESIDGEKAFKIYQDYFGEDAEDLKKQAWAKVGTMYPLGISIPDEQQQCLIRYPIKATDEGALVCVASVPEGLEARLMIADKERVLNAAGEAAADAKISLKEQKKEARILAVIIFDSIARKRLLGRRAKEEIEVIRKALGQAAPIIGFYGYGEQAPFKAGRCTRTSYLHNESVVVLCLAQ